jgi:siroheme synthase-like protein
MLLPLLFKSGLCCLVVGGGQVASRKIAALLAMPCNITVIAPQLCEETREEVQKGSIRWKGREYVKGDCKGFQLVIAATPLGEVNRLVSEEAGELGIPINVVDDPALSTVIFPAIWQDGSLLVAVSTEGVAPFMAARIRTLLADCARGMGRWVEIGGRFRAAVRKEVKDPSEKNRLYQQFLDAGQPDSLETVPDGTQLSDWISWLDSKRKTRN